MTLAAKSLLLIAVLGLAAAFGDGFGEVREEHGEPQPDRDLEIEPTRLREARDGREDRTDEDDEHHGVPDLHPRI